MFSIRTEKATGVKYRAIHRDTGIELMLHEMEVTVQRGEIIETDRTLVTECRQLYLNGELVTSFGTIPLTILQTM